MIVAPKRLIEVDLPIKRISAHARREKSIRHGHISTLHIWWARRPLAACRAVICAALWPDPADPLCPQAFRDAADRVITAFAGKVCGQGKIGTPNLMGTCSEESLARWQVLGKPGLSLDTKDTAHLNLLRFALLDFIADFANWDNSTVPEYLETARALTQAAHEALGGEPGTRPLVVDPFAGGGSIPLEALRVGADAFASDLNPVAVLLNKVVLEYIPKYGRRLADEVRKWGRWIKEQAEKDLAPFYPKDPDGATPIAYLWARTITCEGPGCGAEVPLMRSLWLAKKGSRAVALKMLTAEDEEERGGTKRQRVEFGIVERRTNGWQWVELPPAFAPLRSSAPSAVSPEKGTVRRGSATCPCCGFTTPVASVRKQLKARRGGATDARLYCVVTTRPEQQGRFYRLPSTRDLDGVQQAELELVRRKESNASPLSLVPDEPTPIGGGTGAGRAFGQRAYGMDTFGDLFTPRQLLGLTTLASLVKLHTSQFDIELALLLSLSVNRVADKCASLVFWHDSREFVDHVFARQALSLTWNFAEAPVLADVGWEGAYAWVALTCEALNLASIDTDGHAIAANAAAHPLPDNVADAFLTDPPYYDAVPYADLADFFYVWLKRTLPEQATDHFVGELTPKHEECIVDEVKSKDRQYYEATMKQAMTEGRRFLSHTGIGVVVFAHKSTTGWEALIQAMIDAGWTITGSWPIDTEMATRIRAKQSAALASSVHLVCRPRFVERVGDWRDVLTELPKRIHEWMPRLAREGVVGADAIFACLGPALEIYSRYARVEKASGDQVTLREYLEQVWATVSKEALSMIFAGADASGFDPDARLTAMWFWTLSAGKDPTTEDAESAEEDAEEDSSPRSSASSAVSGFVLEYDAARKIAQGLGAHLEQLTRIIEVKGDKARLLPVSERARQLFGKDEGRAPARRAKPVKQKTLFDESDGEDGEDGNWGELNVSQTGVTVLDRLHQAMILFAAGRGEAMKRFLVEEGIGRDTRFWRLAQALSALYPPGTEEKRWVDGVLGRKKGLGF